MLQNGLEKVGGGPGTRVVIQWGDFSAELRDCIGKRRGIWEVKSHSLAKSGYVKSMPSLWLAEFGGVQNHAMRLRRTRL